MRGGEGAGIHSAHARQRGRIRGRRSLRRRRGQSKNGAPIATATPLRKSRRLMGRSIPSSRSGFKVAISRFHLAVHLSRPEFRRERRRPRAPDGGPREPGQQQRRINIRQIRVGRLREPDKDSRATPRYIARMAKTEIDHAPAASSGLAIAGKAARRRETRMYVVTNPNVARVPMRP